ncbi:type II toxin-antitoxin system RelE/ParE family toxin [Calidifontibacillus oryziterrae]|uniref:type II toxin-antitoxin system RelE/ParE family toxin n=1 Tax=Calidifontibacillus oryziterrae TaxID=1191699 RepID=UPI0002F94CF1|nr:type II toxin-antitoxin system RelE/ParE family toxin [Calidifontibacillus oryziterrae]
MEGKNYRVVWSKKAIQALGRLFNINHRIVFNRSKILLSHSLETQAEGIADFPEFKFNGYYWTLINNVIIVYKVVDEENSVFIQACYFANTEQSHYIFYKIEPEKE